MPDQPIAPSHLTVLLSLLLLTAPCIAQAAEASKDDDNGWRIALGAATQRMPTWLGSDRQQWQPLPFFDIEKPGLLELSSNDGLRVHLPTTGPLEVGVYGDYLWGRSHADLGPRLQGKIPSLSPRLLGGAYAEYQFNEHIAFGSRLGHDFTGSGAYLSLYLDYDLPKIWYLEHSLELGVRGMNSAAMRRSFGLSTESAALLGTRPWAPAAGLQQASANYSLFVPTSLHTGLALSFEYIRLLGDAADSPLIQHYGNRTQKQQSLAFIYHF